MCYGREDERPRAGCERTKGGWTASKFPVTSLYHIPNDKMIWKKCKLVTSVIALVLPFVMHLYECSDVDSSHTYNHYLYKLLIIEYSSCGRSFADHYEFP